MLRRNHAWAKSRPPPPTDPAEDARSASLRQGTRGAAAVGRRRVTRHQCPRRYAGLHRHLGRDARRGWQAAGGAVREGSPSLQRAGLQDLRRHRAGASEVYVRRADKVSARISAHRRVMPSLTSRSSSRSAAARCPDFLDGAPIGCVRTVRPSAMRAHATIVNVGWWLGPV